MASLYNILDTKTNETIVTEETASEIGKRLGMTASHVRSYADRHYKVQRRYLIIDTFKERVEEDPLKAEWDKVRFMINPNAKRDDES